MADSTVPYRARPAETSERRMTVEEQNDVSEADWIWQRVRLISPPPHEDKELREAFDKFVIASSTEALSVYAATPDPVKHKLLRYGR